jgi:hypothetical protein
METDCITYKQLDDLLVHLGFSRQHVGPKWLRYEHAASDTLITLVERGPHEPVRVTDAVSARRHLVEKGLITEDAFEAVLSRHATPQKTVPARPG